MTDQQLSVEQVDPTTLLVDANIRSDAALDKDFLASIRDLGVLVPIVAVRTEDGARRVRYGHRRTLAAVHVGRTSVPVIVTASDGADEVARIVRQWHENEHRAGLSTADKVAAVEQLSLLGLSAAQIVKQTRARKAAVEQALATAGSALAKGAATRYEFLTLDQAGFALADAAHLVAPELRESVNKLAAEQVQLASRQIAGQMAAAEPVREPVREKIAAPAASMHPRPHVAHNSPTNPARQTTKETSERKP
jgi:ParB family chromosome partitioning protein